MKENVMARFLVRVALGAVVAVLAATGMAQEPARPTDLYGDLLPEGAIARLGTIRFRTPDYIRHLAYSPDGKRLVAQGQTKIALWDAETGRKLAEFASDKVGPLAWRGDGRGVMLVTEPGGKERIGDFTRERLKPLPAKNYAGVEQSAAAARGDGEQFHGHAISPDGKYLVVGRTGNRDDRARAISVWEIDTARTLEEFDERDLGPQQGNCHQIIFSPDSKFVGVISGPKLTRTVTVQPLLFILYDLATGKERFRREIPMPRSSFYSELAVALAPEARYLAVGGNDSVCRIYALERDGAEVSFGEPAEIANRMGWSALVFAGDQLFAFRTADTSLYVHDAKTGRAIRPAANLGMPTEALALSRDGKRIAAASSGIIRIFDVASGRHIEPAAGHSSWITGLHVFSDGAKALTWGYRDEPRLWELATGKELRRLPLPSLSATTPGQLIVSPDEKAILAIVDGKVRVFDVHGNPVPAPGGMADASATMLNRATDRRSVIVSDEASVSVWDWPEGRLRRKIELEDDPIMAKLKEKGGWEPRQFHLTADGKQLISRGLLDVAIWDVDTGLQMTLWRGNSIARGDSALALVGTGTIAFSGYFLMSRADEGFIPGNFEGLIGGGGGKGKKGAQVLPAPNQVLPGGLKKGGKGAGFDGQGDPFGGAGGKKKAAPAGGGFQGGGDFFPGGAGAGGGFGGPIKKSINMRGIALWDLRTGKMLRSLESNDGSYPRDIASDPGGYVIATADDDSEGAGMLALYEVATGQVRRRLSGGVRYCTAVAFTPDGNRLVSVGFDTTGIVWDVNLMSAARGKKPAGDEDLERAWKTLAQPSAPAAYDAMIALASNPDGALALLRTRSRPAPVIGAGKFDQIVADLEDEKFVTRERATNELEKLGKVGVSAIRARIGKAQSREAKLRLTQYLEKFDTPALLADELRAIRTLEFLEHAATPAARALIAELSSGEPTADLTMRALAAKGRLDRAKN
jgi:WD40 repeat protein